jgi:hypothetical protein
VREHDIKSCGLNREQVSILDHTMHRAAGGLYCGDGPDMDALVDSGLMAYAGRKAFVEWPYYKITEAGRKAFMEAMAAKPKPVQKPLTRAQIRYQDWLRGPADWIKFGEWLKTRKDGAA